MATNITKEEDNFLRIVYLNYRVGTSALRRYFDNVHPNLPSDLSSPTNKSILASLHKPPRGQRRILYQEQWDILYPPSGSHVVSSTDLDVTLMVCLLRNLPPLVSQPPNGFDLLPQSSVLSPGAHIARIKYYKNFLVSHSKDGKLTDTDFNKIWIDLEMAINGLGNQHDVTNAAEAKSKSLDYNSLQELVHLDKRLNYHTNEIAKHTSMIEKLETTVEVMEKEVQLVKKDLQVGTPNGEFKAFNDNLVRFTILDKEVLDNLISKCILTVDDREEIESHTDQSSRNQRLIEILMHRPYNTFNIFVEAVKESDQQVHTLLVTDMETIVTDKDLTLKNVPQKDEIAGIEIQTVKLIKWYKTIVHEIDINKPGTLDKLFFKQLISQQEKSVLTLENATPQEKSRSILGEIIRKNTATSYTVFLEFLKEDICYTEYATKVEETDVTDFDLELLCIGKMMKNERKRRNGMTDFMIDRIDTWKKDDSLYIETRATTHVLSCVSKYKCVSVTGPSGIGKTALVRHVALRMERNGYTIFTVTDPKEMKDKHDSKRKMLYIVDDMCGNFTANQSRLDEWKKSINDVQSILENSKNKLILTCRLQVFQDKGFDNLDIFKTCECNLSSEKLSLTSYEKEKMTIMYFKENALEALEHLGEYDFLPLLCKLYDIEKTNPRFTLDMFLNDPFSFYKKDLTYMFNDCIEGKYKYCALLLLVIFDNNLEREKFTTKDAKLKDIIEDIKDACDIDENLTGRKLKTHIEILIGTFVMYDEGIYQTIHDKLFDFLAFYFATQKPIIDILIKHAKNRFVSERFIVTVDNESTPYSILISDDKLKIYMERVFSDIVSSCDVNSYIAENKNFTDVKFRTMIFDMMGHLTKDAISSIMQKASTDFFNKMFVSRKKDIKCMVKNPFDECESFGICLPDDMLQEYIEKWFDALILTNSTESFIETNRLFTRFTFDTALHSYMRQLSPENVAQIIQTGSEDFIKTMFVIKLSDINDFAQKPAHRFGVIIPEDIIQQYIERWFNYFTRTDNVEKFFDDSRSVMNVKLRTALQSYMKVLNTTQIASIIQIADGHFINKMFVMTENDIKRDSANRYKCFGLVIHVDLLQQYIEKWVGELAKVSWVEQFIDACRSLDNVSFRTAIRTYMRHLSTEKISQFIQTSHFEFINQMFVMTEDDIKDNAEFEYEGFGIIIPNELLHQYIDRWIDGHAHLGSTWHIHIDIQGNRLFTNVTFRSTLSTYMRKLSTEKITQLIQTANIIFVNTMFVMTEDDIKYNAEMLYESTGIIISNDLLQQYIQSWFGNLTGSYFVAEEISNNRLMMNGQFVIALRTYTRQFDTKKIRSLIYTSSNNFLDEMFVKTQEDINENAENRVECIGIVIPDELLQQYIQRWFDNLTKTLCLQRDIDMNRPINNVSFQSDVRTYLKQLTAEQISSIIRTSSDVFFNNMFVKSEADIKNNTANLYECFGIVIPDNMLQKYINRLFEYLFKRRNDESRPLLNDAFCSDVRTYMRQLTTEKIASIIHTAGANFINTMFVMTETDIKDNDEKRYKCFSIIIPNNLLQQYIDTWFVYLSGSLNIECFMDGNILLMNDTFCTALQTFTRQLNSEKIAFFIQTGSTDFLNRMFVMNDNDIKDKELPWDSGHRYENFGIVIPDDPFLIQQYIETWFDRMIDANPVKEFMNTNRPLMDAAFRTALRTYMRQLNAEEIKTLIRSVSSDFLNTMFVLSENDLIKDNAENLHESFGIVIPDDPCLIQQYIKTLFHNMTNANSVKEFMKGNGMLKNVSSRTALRTHMRQLDAETIEFLIKTGGSDFLNTMFVLSENELNTDNAENVHEIFVIVIPNDPFLIQQYIEKWFDHMTDAHSIKEFMKANRLLKNDSFRTALRTYMRKLNAEKIETLIRSESSDFLNTMFALSENELNTDNAEVLHESFGIVIPDDPCLIQQYIETWFDNMSDADSVKEFMNINRLLKNASFRTSLRTYMRQLDQEQIENLVRYGSSDFLNTMFVLSENELIKDNAENLHESFGIVIPDNILLMQNYIVTWFDNMKLAKSLREFMIANRPLRYLSFRTALRTYMRQLDAENIENLVRSGSRDFLNTMFVLSENDLIKDNAENPFESLGIVIPDDHCLIQQYIEKWFHNMTDAHSVKEFMKANRILKNCSFRTALRTYMRQLEAEKIEILIQTGGSDFLNTMFVLSEADLMKDNAENLYESFGIVIPDDLLQKYTRRWTNCLEKTDSVKEFLDANRSFMKVILQTELETLERFP